MAAKRTAAIAMAIMAASVVALSNGSSCAQTAASDRSAEMAGAALAQAQPRSRRPRARITVTPRYYPYRRQSLPYPPPYDIEYPGPGHVRQCTSRLVQEARPSGTVIVPVSRCWWERG